jgi:hypothetical protein
MLLQVLKMMEYFLFYTSLQSFLELAKAKNPVRVSFLFALPSIFIAFTIAYAFDFHKHRSLRIETKYCTLDLA